MYIPMCTKKYVGFFNASVLVLSSSLLYVAVCVYQNSVNLANCIEAN
jgi:hypothetical protein